MKVRSDGQVTNRFGSQHKLPSPKKSSRPPPPPPPRRKPAPRPSHTADHHSQVSLNSSSKPHLPQAPSETIPLSIPHPATALQSSPETTQKESLKTPLHPDSTNRAYEQIRSQNRINVWDFLGPSQGGEIEDSGHTIVGENGLAFELPADLHLKHARGGTEQILSQVTFASPQEERSSFQLGNDQSPSHTDALPLVNEVHDQARAEINNDSEIRGVSHESAPSLEGFRNELDLAFDEGQRSSTRCDGLELSLLTRCNSTRSRIDRGAIHVQAEDAAIPNNSQTTTNSKHELSKQDEIAKETFSIHSSVDLYDASIESVHMAEESMGPSKHGPRNQETIESEGTPSMNENLEAQMEDLTMMSQQLAYKAKDTPIMDESCAQKVDIKQEDANVSKGIPQVVNTSIEASRSTEVSSQDWESTPQIIMTPSENEVGTIANAQSTLIPNILGSPEYPSRPPPLPPIHATTLPSLPWYGPSPANQVTRHSKIETSTVSSGRTSSLFDVSSSTVSSSEPSEEPLISLSLVNTTPIAIHRPASAQEKAQADLRRLQTELTSAKARGDSHTAQDSLQKSIEVIRNTYLTQSNTAEALTVSESRTRTKFKRFASLPGSTKSGALADTAATGDTSKTKSLLDAKTSVDTRGDDYKTPLMRAAVNGHVGCLRLLKEYGADEFAVDAKGQTVFHLAIMSNKMAVVRWLLEAYPAPQPLQLKHRASFLSKATESFISRPPKNLREASDAEGSRPLHTAVRLNRGDVIKTLLAAGVDIEAKNNWARTPLHESVISNQCNAFDTLIGSGANLNAVDAKSMSSLHWAAKTGHASLIEKLLAAGADRYTYDQDGNQPMHQAAWVGHILCIEMLSRDRSDLKRPTKAGESLLHIACLNKNRELATYLFNNGVEINPWAPAQQRLRDSLSKFKVPLTSLTPLHYACCKADFEMVSLLLDHEAWVNAPTPEGVTSLMMATESEDTNTVNLLLTRGAKVNASMPIYLTTALHIAARRGDLETVQQLCRSGASYSARSTGSGGSYARTPAEEATDKCTDKVKKHAIEDYFRTIRKNKLLGIQLPSMDARQSYEMVGRANMTIPTNGIRPTTQPISYAPWGQQNYGPMPGGQYGFLQTSPATYPAWTLPVQGHIPQQWYDPTPPAEFEIPPPYQAGSSVPARLAAQAPVHRPEDDSRAKYA